MIDERVESIFYGGYDDITTIELLSNLGIDKNIVKSIFYGGYDDITTIELLSNELKEA